MALREVISFSINTEVTSTYFNELLVFIYQNYILPSYQSFTNIRRWVVDDREVLAFTFLGPQGLWYIDVEVMAGNPVHVRIIPSGGDVPRSVLNRLKEDLIIGVQLFEEKVRRTTLYFAWVQREDMVLEAISQRRKNIITQIFRGQMLFLFVIFITLSYLVFLIFEYFNITMLLPIVLVISQFFFVLFSDKIVMKMGDWPITPDNPNVYILQYHIPPEEIEVFRLRYTRSVLLQMKREIYERTLALGRPIDAQTAREVFFEHGINCRPESLSVKTFNIYHIVKSAAETFNLPIPKVMISNIIIPNAAATGPSPSRGLVLITTGLLVQLEEEEILSIVGHELSHLRSRDPLALYALSSLEYLVRVYFFLPFLLYFGFFYFLFALTMVFFIAKFFEARADLESAMRMGRPKVLAGALRKIGFRRLQIERLHSNRVGSWLGMDPHPPLYFRIERLESLDESSRIRHPFLRSVLDCINGFLSTLRA